ncbi:MAG: peptidoglycan bridge formation glycyltransferase FemA/FemB family protein [Micrococcaceae bacterium]
MYRYKKLTQAQFDEIADAHPDTFIPFEQSPEWDKFDELMGGRDIQGVFGYYNDVGEIVATAKINIMHQKLRTSVVITQGPIWYVESTAKAETELVETLKKQFTKDKKTGALYFRLQLNNEIPGAVRPFELVTFDRAMYIDITPDEKALLKSFKADVRQSIRKAGRLGVEVREIPNDEREQLIENELMDLMNETQERNDFRGHPARVYVNMMKAFPEKARLYVAYSDEKPIAWLISTEYRGHAVYLYAASGQEARKRFATYALQWYCIREMKERGNKVWDMTGIESPNYPNLENVTVFKRKFSNWEVQFPLVYDVPVNKAKYKAIAKLYQLRRKAL